MHYCTLCHISSLASSTQQLTQYIAEPQIILQYCTKKTCVKKSTKYSMLPTWQIYSLLNFWVKSIFMSNCRRVIRETDLNSAKIFHSDIAASFVEQLTICLVQNASCMQMYPVFSLSQHTKCCNGLDITVKLKLLLNRLVVTGKLKLLISSSKVHYESR